jgi:hypothetical protein
MLLKDVGIDGRHHDVVLAVDDKRALLDLLQIAVAVCRGDCTPFSKSDELGLGDLGLRFWFAVQLSRGDPLEPGLARRVTRRALRKEQVQRAFLRVLFGRLTISCTSGVNSPIPSPPDGPVPARRMRRTSSGASSTTCCATMPPIEKPNRSISFRPSA